MTPGAGTPDLASIRQAATLIRKAKQVVVLTGAGISTPSGIPDFRSPQSGLWTQQDPLEVASLSTFRTRPGQFYDWIRPLAEKILNAEPNVAHYALSALEEAGIVSTIITQNIDGLHQQAGSKNVIEVHGSIGDYTCIQCYRKITSGSQVTDHYIQTGLIPHCPDCDGILKPNVVLVEEQLPFQPWMDALAASKSAEVMVVAGSSLQVMPVAGLPMRVIERDGSLIIVNLQPTYIDVRAESVIYHDVADVLPLIAEEAIRG